jgi:hypothetical protein
MEQKMTKKVPFFFPLCYHFLEVISMKKILFSIIAASVLLSGCSDEALADRQAEQEAAYDAAFQAGYDAGRLDGYKEGYQDASKNQTHIVDTDAAETDEEYLFFHTYAVCVNDGSNRYHRYHCPEFSIESFYIYNIDKAIDLGYHPCTQCMTP